MFSYQIDQQNQDVTIHFNGDLDIEVSEVMEEEIIPNLLRFNRVVIDFDGVLFVDSTGIGLFIYLVETLKKNREDVQIIIQHVQPLVKEVFEILQLEEILGEKVQF